MRRIAAFLVALIALTTSVSGQQKSTIRFGNDAFFRKHVSGTPQYYLMEYVRDGETLHTWKHLVTIIHSQLVTGFQVKELLQNELEIAKSIAASEHRIIHAGNYPILVYLIPYPGGSVFEYNVTKYAPYIKGGVVCVRYAIRFDKSVLTSDTAHKERQYALDAISQFDMATLGKFLLQ